MSNSSYQVPVVVSLSSTPTGGPGTIMMY